MKNEFLKLGLAASMLTGAGPQPARGDIPENRPSHQTAATHRWTADEERITLPTDADLNSLIKSRFIDIRSDKAPVDLAKIKTILSEYDRIAKHIQKDYPTLNPLPNLYVDVGNTEEAPRIGSLTTQEGTQTIIFNPSAVKIFSDKELLAFAVYNTCCYAMGEKTPASLADRANNPETWHDKTFVTDSITADYLEGAKPLIDALTHYDSEKAKYVAPPAEGDPSAPKDIPRTFERIEHLQNWRQKILAPEETHSPTGPSR